MFSLECPVCDNENSPHFILDTYPPIYSFECTCCGEKYSSRDPKEVYDFIKNNSETP